MRTPLLSHSCRLLFLVVINKAVFLSLKPPPPLSPFPNRPPPFTATPAMPATPPLCHNTAATSIPMFLPSSTRSTSLLPPSNRSNSSPQPHLLFLLLSSCISLSHETVDAPSSSPLRTQQPLRLLCPNPTVPSFFNKSRRPCSFPLDPADATLPLCNRTAAISCDCTPNCVRRPNLPSTATSQRRPRIRPPHPADLLHPRPVTTSPTAAAPASLHRPRTTQHSRRCLSSSSPADLAL